jgi:hypothetical protein
MSPAATTAEEPFHVFAWDGFSLDVPDDWNLSYYDFERRTARLRMEDDTSVCLEMEWTRPKRHVATDRIRERYAAKSKRLFELAAERSEIDELPPGWSAFVLVMPDKRCLVNAFWLAPRGAFFCLLNLHLGEGGRRKAVRVARRIARSFRLHEGDRIPWSLYDMAFVLHRDFKLQTSSLQAGRKLMVFQWRLRRLYLWQFSLADMLLKERGAAEWAAEFLNGFKELRGAKFSADSRETLAARRNWRYPLGHYDEIGRWCGRFRAAFLRRPETNMLFLMAYNYRKAEDVKILGGAENDFRRTLERCLDAGALLGKGD